MKLNIQNKVKIRSAISTAQKGCNDGLLKVKDITKSIAIIEKRLTCMLLKQYWTDLEFTVNVHWSHRDGQRQPLPDCTQFSIKRFSSGWFITSIWRGGTQRPGITTNKSFQSKGEELAQFAERHFH